MIEPASRYDIKYPPYKPYEKEECMRGDIYSREVCPECGEKFRNDNRQRALICPNHPKQRATSFYIKFGSTYKRFKTYQSADTFLTGVRHETNWGKFDERDYRKDQPLGFANLADQYLERQKVLPSYRQIRYHLNIAIDFFQNKNIKLINYAELEDFLLVLPKRLSGKSKKNILTTLHAFWVWLRRRKIIRLDQFPEFPEIKYELGWRKLVDKETQISIIEEIKRITLRNQKIHIGIKWLSTYFSIRPGEMLNIKEGDFDFHLGGVLIRKPKEKKPKFVPFLSEDLEIVKSYATALPHVYFFRHEKGYGGVKPGSKMGRDCLWKAWHKACLNLGIEGVDLYGGTKHSSMTDLKKYFSPEQIKKASRISSNAATDRYLQFELADSVEIYRISSATKALPKITPFKRGKLLK